VTRREQKRRRAAVALHADDEEILFRVRELPRAVRADRAAAVLVGIDQRSERSRAFEPRIESEPHFAQHVEIRAEAGADDHLVNIDAALLAANRARHLERVTMRRDRAD